MAATKTTARGRDPEPEVVFLTRAWEAPAAGPSHPAQPLPWAGTDAAAA
jgi:hypothetical protein